MKNAKAQFTIKFRKRLMIAGWLERNLPSIFETENVQKEFVKYFRKNIDNCVRIKLIQVD